MRTTHINASTNDDGSRNVSFYNGPDVGWLPAGRLMPEVRNYVKEQPTNRYKPARMTNCEPVHTFDVQS